MIWDGGRLLSYKIRFIYPIRYLKAINYVSYVEMLANLHYPYACESTYVMSTYVNSELETIRIVGVVVYM